ncbi:hypothetical protein M097_3563 [Phocaeicola vulgatus str. 3775 SL(B) 10 (iv)]|uniref:Uncharacterized protein n=1 Tax=Phocaeicola vulgatus str. 3775 SL(B) 10 (iv) TaxID=1339350 RepID=A0A078QXR2_PHOVU|nr:hypothetical protein M098_2498 [Phocaeicola vulgatus str. 3775 SR(B) 19]KDS27880.1 hypothetical protein M097_3563 [Phocaeicola vulgatus str. 3775 SL(B) 10 (iv)]
MNCNCVPYKIRRDHRSSSPSLNDNLLAAFIHSKHFLFKFNVNIWTFF